MPLPEPIARRTLIGGALAVGTLLATPTFGLAPSTLLPGAVVPIGRPERERRIEQLRCLMRAQGIVALLIEPGASLIYFTGIQWRRSERVTAAIIPLTGDVVIVTPFFEAPSVGQTLGIAAEIRTWNEDEDPLALIATTLRDHGAGAGSVAIEETLRYLIVDGIKKALPGAAIVSGASVVRGCRMHKSPAEIALMQRATDVTIAAYRATIPRVAPGMMPAEVSKIMNANTVALGGSPAFALALMGEAAAYPHGSRDRQVAREGEVVLMDCGCTVEGYQSDVSRTGHGIGLDGHEPVNLVHRETTRLAPGMCFSDEPGLYIPGAFGVRLEDCFHMTEAGPRWLSQPAEGIDRVV